MRFAIRVLVAFLRTMPELAWAVIFVMAFGIGAIPGFLALMLHTVGSLTKLFYEAVESAQTNRYAAWHCGASPLQKIRFALWPQVKPLFLSYGFMRLEINFRSSTILGLVGAGGIGQELMTNIKLDRYDQVSITLLLIILVVSALDMLSGRLRLWVLEGKKMSVWHMQPDLAASRRQHKQLYQVQGRYLRYVGLVALACLLYYVWFFCSSASAASS